MIPAKDLRIGNLYKGASRGNIEIASGQTIAQIEEGKLNALPIELTPEILEAAGFENSWTGKENKANGFYKRKECQFQIGYIVQDEFFETEINGQIIILKYVHSFQNLYHALTGEDLKIELPTTGKE